MDVNPSIVGPAVSAGPVGAAENRETLTPGQLVWRRFRKHRMAMMGGVGVIILLLFILVGSIIIPESAANNADLQSRLSPPSATHWFGTDSVGRDVFDDPGHAHRDYGGPPRGAGRHPIRRIG